MYIGEVYIHVHTRIDTCIYVYVQVYIHTYVCIYIRMYVYIRIVIINMSFSRSKFTTGRKNTKQTQRRGRNNKYVLLTK